jgi:hypothetical protein
VFSPKRPNDYQGHRSRHTDHQTGSFGSLSVLIGAAMIAAAILLSTLISALGSRYVAVEGPTDESAWLVDRLTGTMYKCEAQGRGKAACEPDIATGSIGTRPKP